MVIRGIIVYMNWYTQRRFMYGGAVLFFITAFALYTLRDSLFPAPTCFDSVKNGNENGIDCGGTCSLKCTQDIVPLTVSWSRALKTSSTTYDFVAMISNKNIDNSPRALPYTFTALSNDGTVLAVVSGTTSAPVDGEFPIVRQNILLSDIPKELVTHITDGPHFGVKELPTSPTLRILSTRYEAGSIPRVYTVISNTKRVTVSNLPVRVLLYDINGNSFATGETLIPFLDKEQTKEISFTWNTPFASAPTRILVYPIFDPFSSSQ